MGIIGKIKSLFKREKNTVEESSSTIVEESTEDIKMSLKKEQEAIYAAYKQNGLTDEILERQVALNQKRNKLNIPDETKMTDSNKGFVQ